MNPTPAGEERSIKTLLLVAAALLLIPASARAQFGSDRWGLDGAQDPRIMVGGGIGIPLFSAPSSYRIGWGASLGLELPKSAYHAFVIRLDYDHMNEGFDLFPDAGYDRGSANVGSMTVGVRLVRRERGWMHEYTEGAVGMTAARWSWSVYEYSASGSTATLRSESQFGAVFSIGAGVEVIPETGGPGFFLDTRVQYMFQGGGTSQMVPVRLGLLFTREP